MSIVHKTLRRDQKGDAAEANAAARPVKSRPTPDPVPAPASTPDPEIEGLRVIVRTREKRIQELERALHELDRERTEALRKSEARVQALETQVQALVQKLAEAVAGLQQARKREQSLGGVKLQSPGSDPGSSGSLLSQAKSRR